MRFSLFVVLLRKWIKIFLTIRQNLLPPCDTSSLTLLLLQLLCSFLHILGQFSPDPLLLINLFCPIWHILLHLETLPLSHLTYPPSYFDIASVILDISSNILYPYLGQEEGYAVKYTTSPEGVPEGEAEGNPWRQRGIFDRIYSESSPNMDSISFLQLLSL